MNQECGRPRLFMGHIGRRTSLLAIRRNLNSEFGAEDILVIAQEKALFLLAITWMLSAPKTS